jgi:hypothetical protein
MTKEMLERMLLQHDRHVRASALLAAVEAGEHETAARIARAIVDDYEEAREDAIDNAKTGDMAELPGQSIFAQSYDDYRREFPLVRKGSE